MLQPHAFCEHTIQQNATAAAGGAYSAPQTPYLVKGAVRGGEGEGKGEKGKGEEVDSDAQLEQGRRLAKAGPHCMCCIVTGSCPFQRSPQMQYMYKWLDDVHNDDDVYSVGESLVSVVVYHLQVS